MDSAEVIAITNLVTIIAKAAPTVYQQIVAVAHNASSQRTEADQLQAIANGLRAAAAEIDTQIAAKRRTT
jgi:hypothetical protein